MWIHLGGLNFLKMDDLEQPSSGKLRTSHNEETFVVRA